MFPAVYITDPAGLALISSGRDTGVVLDVGGSVSHVTVLNKGILYHLHLHYIIYNTLLLCSWRAYIQYGSCEDNKPPI